MSITLQIILCILIADILTGFIHWLEDSYCEKSLPLIGSGVCIPNIDHHKYPTLMTRGASLIITNYQSVSIAMFTCFILYLFGLYSWQILLTLLIASMGNQIHLWNHQIKSCYFPQFLKDSGLIQSQKQHNLHHKPPYDTNYCVILSFNNAWLDRIRFWRILEYGLDKLGLKIKRGTDAREGY